jgi:hypothetical protein
MVNIKINFNFIIMMLMNFMFNMHSSRFEKNHCIFKKKIWWSKLVQVDENGLLNIFHFQHNVTQKYTCKFSMFKYYNRIHQISNEKTSLNSILLVIFKHTC